MYNQSGISSNLYGDIFKMREFMIKDIVMKNSIDKIKNRPKNAKDSIIKNINNFYTIKKPVSPRLITKSPIKTFIPITNIIRNSPIKTSPPLMKTKKIFHNASVSKFNYQYKVTNESEKIYQTHQNYKNHYLDAKRRDSLNKSILIDRENEKFGKKLKRINSPLSRERLNELYSKLKEYGNIAKKTKSDRELNLKKINSVKLHLPPLLIRGSANKKFVF